MLDENLPRELAQFLRDNDHDVLEVAADRLDFGVSLFDLVARDHLALQELRIARIGNAQGLSEALILLAEPELVNHIAREQLAVAYRLDVDLSQHLRDDNLRVLVVYCDALASVDGLYFT